MADALQLLAERRPVVGGHACHCPTRRADGVGWHLRRRPFPAVDRRRQRPDPGVLGPAGGPGGRRSSGAARHLGVWQHLPASRRARQPSRDRRPDQRWSGRARARCGLAGERARGVRHRTPPAGPPARHARRGVPGRERFADSGSDDLRRHLLPTRQCALRAEACAGSASIVDRRWWREANPADRGTLCRRMECVGHARATRAQGAACSIVIARTSDATRARSSGRRRPCCS